MRIYQKELKFKTKNYYDTIDITDEIEKEVKKSKINNGLISLFLKHNTAALLIQENDETIFEDIKNFLEKMLPLNERYSHSYEGNINATAHLKNLTISRNLVIPIENGKLILGQWQRIILIELFEPRERKVYITIIGD
ncbi:MAG: secondary thiamine-phosphate synthase enzyme YjbQ [Candidatus Aenigmatarchaeota archaeon]